MASIDVVGYLAATLTTAAFLPQVLQVWQSKSTKDLSLPTLLSFIDGVSTHIPLVERAVKELK